MRTIATALLVTALLSVPFLAQGRTWYVKADGTGDAPTINAALEAAASGDTVLVALGTYHESVLIYRPYPACAFDLTLISEAGPELTTIDAGGTGPGIRCNAAINMVIEGFTITGGYTEDHAAGGIEILATCTTRIHNNVIIDNVGHRGGIRALGGSPAYSIEITDNVVANNEGLWSAGGIYVHEDMSATISGNVIYGNLRRSGGICIGPNVDALVENNTVVGNTCILGNGAGISIFRDSWVELRGNIVASNFGSGGITCDVTGPTLSLACSCNDVWNHPLNYENCLDPTGTVGNISQDPMFCDAPTNDYHLDVRSRCAIRNSRCEALIGALPVRCSGAVPTEAATWGRVKAMYR